MYNLFNKSLILKEKNKNMAEKTYSKSPELKQMAEKLKDRYYLHLGYIDLDNIYFGEIDGAKPKKAGLIEISGVSSPWVRQLMIEKNNTLYCIACWGIEWEELSPARREWWLFNALHYISPENDGKLRKPDVQEWGIICECKEAGPYWKTKEFLPSLLDGNEPVPFPLPRDTTDEGSTL